jgi:GT2 family glycosyltransferase
VSALAVVVVAYRSAGHLADTLSAVRAQLRADDELIVVDNASPDDSAAVARSAAPDARVLELAVNGGFAAGCQAGAAATSAPLLLFLNPDAHLAAGCLDALRAAADEHPGWGAWQAVVTLPGGARVNTSGGVLHWLGIGWSGQCDEPIAAVPPAPREIAFASGAAFVVRRAAWDATGGFEPAFFMYCEDVDLSLRLRLQGWGVGAVPAARVEHAYEFARGSWKWELLERNRWWAILTTYPGPLLALTLPALLAFELALLPLAAANGWLPSKLRAQAAVIRTLPWALRRRRRVQRARRVGVRAFAAPITASLESPYLGAAARLRPLVAAQAAYWRTVRRALPA